MSAVTRCIRWLERRGCHVVGIRQRRRGGLAIEFIGPWGQSVDVLSVETLRKMVRE